MTKNAARTAALVAVATAKKAEGAKDASVGWNPYEVWRTRVLLPRLVKTADPVPEVGPPPKR